MNQSVVSAVRFREDVQTSDGQAVRALAAATGFFRPDEIEVAVSLVDERMRDGTVCSYRFVFAEIDGHTAGYTCYGEIPCTSGSFDLYWIIVDPARQGAGLGRKLLRETEQRIADSGGRKIYIETSGSPRYVATRAFYQRCGYQQVAELADFYLPGDAKLIFEKAL